MSKASELTVPTIIVNYGTAHLVRSAVESILCSEAKRVVEIHIVDNSSPDPEEPQRLAELANDWPGQVHLHLEPVNHGFGRGNNIVLSILSQRSSPPRLVFFLNPDAVLRSNVIDELADFLEAHPRAAIVGPRIEGPDGELTVASAFRFPGIVSEFVGAARIGPLSRLLKKWRIDFPPDLSTQQVDWVAGAAFMARFSALEEVGYFDPAFFLYYEETDLHYSIKRKGWEIWHFAQSRVRHIEGAATGIRRRDAYRRQPEYWFESWKYYFIKNNGILNARLSALARVSGAVIDVIFSGLRGRPRAMPHRFCLDFFLKVVLSPFGGVVREARNSKIDLKDLR